MSKPVALFRRLTSDVSLIIFANVKGEKDEILGICKGRRANLGV